MKSPFYKITLKQQLKSLAKVNSVQGKELSILDDVVFKALFSFDSDDSRAALLSILSACTGREITDVEVANNELAPAHLGAKSPRLDVHVTFNDGEAADLEMQLGKTEDDLKTRAEYCTALLLSGQSKKGKPYKLIKRVYQIFFLNFVLYPDSLKIPRRYFYTEETEHDRLSNLTEIIFYEMPKLEQKVLEYLTEKTGLESLSLDTKWCIYMKYRHEEWAAALIKELCRKEDGIMKAEKAVTKISRDYRKFARNMAIMKNSMDRASEIYNARLEGKAEGLAEGEAKGHQQIIDLLKSGKSPEEIIRDYQN